ncbi:hypothetical protein H1D32_22090 [Anaerobacillus sp. CMMVII]|uniref:DUF6470 family protein n=1 Tax=Anaerobacillus sp. CMMVII TaxID=2755588 RepID=UPI0021B77F92|nr:DUF6470 family protein [Anaerobacillus sp. CMMVII]MCT8140148.1 hypothetical protein [Anaerobacillus sp. CMMVII]
MQLPTIAIQSVRGQTGMHSQRPHIEIKQASAVLSINQEHASIQMNTQPAKLSIDQTQAFASANLKHVYQLNKEFAAKAMSNASQVTAKYAREGDQLMKIENGGNVIPHLAKVNSVLFPEKQATVGQMPGPFQVKIHFQPSKTSVQVKGGIADIQVQRHEPTIQHRPWQTNIYLQQKQSISFQAVGVQVNQQL